MDNGSIENVPRVGGSELGVGSEKCGLGVSPSGAPFQDSWELGVALAERLRQRSLEERKRSIIISLTVATLLTPNT